jgi:3-phosphoglycerate kinase
MIKEVDNLTKCVDPKKRIVLISPSLGGFKVSDKIKVIETFSRSATRF